MALLDTLFVFVVSLLIGALGIYVGARVVTGSRDYVYAVATALIGAIVWAVVGFFLGWIPFLGPVVTFLAYLGVIKARYTGGWFDAFIIAAIAWVATIIVLYVLGLFGFQAMGVPGA